MVHLAPLPPWRRRAQRIVGILLAVLGVVVLVIAIIALRQPNGHQAALHTSGVAESSVASARPPRARRRRRAAARRAPASSSSAAPTSSASLDVRPSTPLKAVPLVVLNNTNKTGLADTAAGRFRAGGWTVTSTGNLVNNIISTCAYYDPNVAERPGGGDRAAGPVPGDQAGGGEVQRAAGRPDRRGADHRLQLTDPQLAAPPVSEWTAQLNTSSRGAEGTAR